MSYRNLMAEYESLAARERERFRKLIATTMLEFNNRVMLPLQCNIQRYDTDRNKYALTLNLQYRRYSTAVDNFEELSADILELDDFQLSQLLSLCRDISELYELPIYKKMPQTIPDNHPVTYVTPNLNMPDTPSRRRFRNPQELIFAREVLGWRGEEAYRNTNILLLIVPGYSDAGYSPPTSKTMYLGKDYFLDPMRDGPSGPVTGVGYGRDLFIHELFHQVQYMLEPRIAARELTGDFFRNLGSIYVYAYDYSKVARANGGYQHLRDLPYYEAQAQMVGHFASFYYDARHKSISPQPYQRGIIKGMARILENSDLVTEATEWVKSNL